MSRHSPGISSKGLDKYPQGELSKRGSTPRQRSQLKGQAFHKTPLNNHSNPYLEQLELKSTDKKRGLYSQSYHAPALIEQNRQLMAQNQEMALLIHKNTLLVQALEDKYSAKLQEESQMLKQMEGQKEIFVNEVTRHNQQTKRQIADLEEALSRVQDEKLDMEKMYERQRVNQRQLMQKERRNQVFDLTRRHNDNMSMLQAEKLKLKSDLQLQKNKRQILQGQHKQEKAKLSHEIERAKDEIKHSEHIRKLEQAQLKQHFDNKIHKLHLENRKEKEVFLVQYQHQTKRLQAQIQMLKNRQEKQQVQLKQKEFNIEKNIQDQLFKNQKLEHRVEQDKHQIKQKCHKDRKVLFDVLTSQNQVSKAASNQQIISLTLQNQRLSQLLKVKTKEQTKLYGEIDQLRTRYCSDLEQYQHTIQELLSKLFLNQAGNQEQKEVLKTKLGLLRQVDLKGLRQFYQNQLKLLSNQLVQKEGIVVATRDKLHQQLRKKSQMRKLYEMDSSLHKSRIMELNTRVKDLQAELKTGQFNRAVIDEHVDEKGQKTERGREKAQTIRQDQIEHLHAIIKAKDLQIQELQNKKQLLKHNQVQQVNQKELQIRQINDKFTTEVKEKVKQVQRLQAQVLKLKAIIEDSKTEFDKQIRSLNQQRSEEVNRINNKFAQEQQNYAGTIIMLKNDIKTLNLEIFRLKSEVEVSKQQNFRVTTEFQGNQLSQKNKQKQDLEQFYQDQLISKDNEIDDLKQLNIELRNDILDARENYSNLQKKLQSLIESQSQLRQLQTKVMNLGTNNNLINNLSQPLT